MADRSKGRSQKKRDNLALQIVVWALGQLISAGKKFKCQKCQPRSMVEKTKTPSEL
jgi:hypothetical protein